MLALETDVLIWLANGATLVTRDRAILRYGEVGHVSVLAA